MSESVDPEIGAPRETPPHVRVPIGIERALGAVAMALICLISFGNVVVRYTTDVSFAFTEEFSVFLLVFMTFVGASLAFATNENIRIAFLRDRFGPRGRMVCDVVAALACLLMFGLVVWYGGQLTLDEYRFDETSPGLGYPNWIYTIWLPLLSIAILLRVFGRLLATLRGSYGGRG
ncbi:TRAP-type C4-dicarboxylate transport system, small permease component [Tistlia consotensis]|uniref:TRAP transporter small permease protein n=1 Tax=Tistlia consotensis USBA 355 TaxID=560819 RepID=A0A1Y6B3Q4_9PROT|nr:TRAP transporter small permease [Tistlia consotensis]SME89920.1 TRAP-type C4-dicarboxylate transport system, small permease component [Tistlia consotensis USBA 355]SNR26438.1 TRAP-type C4-dicarboxylate transport system, small permease component [Tistlia consotensis]